MEQNEIWNNRRDPAEWKKKWNNEKQIQRRFYYGEQTKKPRDIHLSLAENSEKFPLKMIAMTEINFNDIYFSKIEPLIQSFDQRNSFKCTDPLYTYTIIHMYCRVLHYIFHSYSE